MEYCDRGTLRDEVDVHASLDPDFEPARLGMLITTLLEVRLFLDTILMSWIWMVTDELDKSACRCSGSSHWEPPNARLFARRLHSRASLRPADAHIRLLQVARGMAFLHFAGGVHSDLRSGNILLKSSRRDLRGFTVKIGAHCGI